MRHLRIERLSRKTHAGVVETLNFRDGLNLVTGPPNAGKTQWVRMLDYLFADPEPFFNRFPRENFAQYESIAADVRLGGESFQLERFLGLDGMKTKVEIDGTSHDLKGFQHWLLEKLDYPTVRYPKGVSSLERTWPELSFRTLYRHIYRQQRFWSDLADRQTPIETSACILQFLDLAADVYGEDLQKLRSLRERADRHSVEIYAGRMALWLMAGGSVEKLPDAKALNALNPTRIVSKLEEEHSVLEAAIQLEPESLASVQFLDRARLDQLVANARRAGESHERLRFAEILQSWSSTSEMHLKQTQQEIWELSERVRLTDLSDLLKKRTDFLCEAMNEYLRLVNQLNPQLWRHRDVCIRISRRNELQLCVGDVQWDRALGGSDGLLFLMAYHYGLLSLSTQDEFRYPGIVVVDFPAYFRGRAISEIEGLVTKPFADLLEREAFSTCQVIFLGASFSGENRCHRIMLDSGYLH